MKCKLGLSPICRFCICHSNLGSQSTAVKIYEVRVSQLIRMEQMAFLRNSVPLLFCRYCKVFQYLLRLKRIQLELEKSWAEAMQQDRAYSAKQRRDAVNGTSATQRQQQRMPMWRIRQHMTYLITNLQFYIQVHYHTHFLNPALCYDFLSFH